MAAKKRANKRKDGDDDDDDDDYEDDEDEDTVCRNLSGKTSRPPRSRLLEASKSVPNARSGSPWCVGRRSVASTLLITVVKTKYTVVRAADLPVGIRENLLR